eukprot:CAMPEP_0114489382 /NCGR_PEP_ID=MMETSP0109-20121206/1862_1 /TAXON_ID=29199 /ORGANISM="Chlorarachnion reptans, Strain CCCM449" /LENGTH=140 /DNA_ID=CAMNT_0001665895 /DNA_START=946 /DNA_END=1366 /DNA_ORIENTATION=+
MSLSDITTSPFLFAVRWFRMRQTARCRSSLFFSTTFDHFFPHSWRVYFARRPRSWRSASFKRADFTFEAGSSAKSSHSRAARGVPSSSKTRRDPFGLAAEEAGTPVQPQAQSQAQALPACPPCPPCLPRGPLLFHAARCP